MLEISLDKLCDKARECSAKKIPWHHHLLPINCMYNHAGLRYQLVLENEDDGQSFVAISSERPTKWLNALEELKK